jgi:hypothetical protein
MQRSEASRQIHVRVSADLKKAVKMFCVRTGTTEQSWLHAVIEDEMHRKAPDLWTKRSSEQTPRAKRQ